MSNYISPAAEFPNDNPALHEGAIWVCVSPCAVATAELPEGEGASVGVDVSARVRVDGDVDVDVGVVPVAGEIKAAPVLELAIDETVIASPIVPDDEEEEIEIVDELDAIDDEEDELEEVATTDAAPDPFRFYVQTLTDVMIAAGDSDAAAHLVAALSEEPTACAWRRIITGESEDYAACGAKSLDEWSAELVARLIAMPGKTDQLRRELRSRGVAAFGLVVE